MQIALNQTGFPVDDLKRNLDVIADAGYDGVEPNFAPDGTLRDPEATQDFAETASRYNLEIPSVSTTIHWKYPLSSPDESTRERGMEYARRMVQAAETLDADTVLIVPGVLRSDQRYDQCYEAAMESVRKLAADVPAGITIGIENVGNDILLSPREFLEFVDDANQNGSVGAYFDVGNAIYYGQHPQQWIRMLDDRIARVHVKGFDEHGTTYPLQGDVDWPSVAGALDAIDYDGWVAAEVPPYNHAPELTPEHVLEAVREGMDIE